jgi:hypothetical protein
MIYAISSHSKYYQDTYPVIVQSLLDANISSKNIIMVVGGCESGVVLKNPLGIRLVSVEYNSFDLTALIYISDIIDTVKADHVFLMHDTCFVGPNFKTLSEQYSPNDIIKTLRPAISMNIGLYSKQIIAHSKGALDYLKFYPKTENEVQQVKEFFVINEDIIFKQCPEQCYLNYYVTTGRANSNLNDLKLLYNREPYISYFEKLQKSSIQREVGYGEELDFYKLQANTGWGGLWKIGI